MSTEPNLSKCSEEEIQVLKFALKNKKVLTGYKIPEEKIVTYQGLCVGAVWLLFQVAKQLGIVKALGSKKEAKLSLWMTISALIGSVSRLSAARLAQTHAACDILSMKGFCEDDLYEALDWLNDNQEKIEDRLFKRRYKNKTPNLFLYDVTSSYLEGDQNELAAYGYNRDGKKGKKQIVVGLLTDDEGFPVSCEVFQGNMKDTQTFKNQIDKVVHRFGVKNVTFVGDRGMIKSVQIDDLSDADLNYITALTKPQIESLLNQKVFQMELFDKDICEVINNQIRYVLRRNPIRVKEIKETRRSKFDTVKKYCSQMNLYLEEHPRAKPDVAMRNINEKIEKLKIGKWVNVELSDRTLNVEKDKEKLKKEEELDGCYVIKTNLLINNISKDTIHNRYKSLAEVEWAFRTMKTSLLHIRGIYVRKENRTRAHVVTIMLAYMIAYELRRKWRDIEITIQEGIEELSTICAIEVAIGNISINKIPVPRETGRILFESANITLPESLPCRKEIVYTRKKLVDERRLV